MLYIIQLLPVSLRAAGWADLVAQCILHACAICLYISYLMRLVMWYVVFQSFPPVASSPDLSHL